MDEDEEFLEKATDLALRQLLNKKEFMEKWRQEVEADLKELQSRPGTSKEKPKTQSSEEKDEVEMALQELSIIIRMVSKNFAENCGNLEFLQNNRQPTSREAGLLFEVGLKVERISGIENTEKNREEIENQICCACRRIGHILKIFNNKIGDELHIGSCYSMAAKICDYCYTICQQVERFSRTRRKKIIRKFVEQIDGFNTIVVETLEKALTKMKEKKKKEEKKRLASSIQDGIRKISITTSTRTHQPGSIAENIVTRNRGFMISDSLYRARSKVPTTSKEKMRKKEVRREEKREENNPENSTSSEDYVMKTAAVISKEIIGELKNCMKIGKDEHLYLGLKR